MLKFLHCADLHLDSPFKGLSHLPREIFERIRHSTFRAFSEIVSVAIKEQVDFIVIAGDIYDGDSRSLRAQSYFRKELGRLDAQGIAVYMIHGNHDHLEGTWIDLEWPKNVHLFDGGHPQSVPFYKNGRLKAMLHGFSYEKRSVAENRVPFYPAKSGDDVYHIGILHGNAEGQNGHEAYAPFRVAELFEKGYDYWALGHIHKRMELHHDPPVIYPGNIQGRNQKETGPKGCLIIDLQNKRRTFHETNDIYWLEKNIDLTDLSSVSKMIDHCLDIKENARIQGKGILLKLVLNGHSALFNEMEQEGLLEELLETLQAGEGDQTSFVYTFAIINQTRRNWNREELQNDGGFIGALLTNGTEYIQTQKTTKELYLHRKARKYIDPLTPNEEKEIVDEAETLLLQFLLKD
ncbi:DNA repair exonuclease SbcCD nuclease subunit [Fictibacillus enclensis]|nr:DNA repair exonuclease SbcCD nuclease subunit [Fictibacillus enclensis]